MRWEVRAEISKLCCDGDMLRWATFIVLYLVVLRAVVISYTIPKPLKSAWRRAARDSLVISRYITQSSHIVWSGLLNLLHHLKFVLLYSNKKTHLMVYDNTHCFLWRLYCWFKLLYTILCSCGFHYGASARARQVA